MEQFTDSHANGETSVPSAAVLDERYISSTFGEDADFLREVLETYIGSSELLCGQIEDAISQGDAASIRAVAHTLKGSSRMIGANAFAHHCQDVETGGEDIFVVAGKMLKESDLLIAECQRRLAHLKSTGQS